MPEKDLPCSRKIYPSPFSVRLNQEERDELEKMAGGLPLGTYIKESLFVRRRIGPYSR
ncbi:hypothetical protein [Desulfatitalea tepidiphila]|uniref:hypothetical protein n=1 Tax=Desulfatitalea tepidiphila TaxID=1185843 RepID=UPI0013793A69|nr:hypothetical protein [Desulfatitalea tepidiphila]